MGSGGFRIEMGPVGGLGGEGSWAGCGEEGPAVAACVGKGKTKGVNGLVGIVWWWGGWVERKSGLGMSMQAPM